MAIGDSISEEVSLEHSFLYSWVVDKQVGVLYWVDVASRQIHP